MDRHRGALKWKKDIRQNYNHQFYSTKIKFGYRNHTRKRFFLNTNKNKLFECCAKRVDLTMKYLVDISLRKYTNNILWCESIEMKLTVIRWNLFHFPSLSHSLVRVKHNNKRKRQFQLLSCLSYLIQVLWRKFFFSLVFHFCHVPWQCVDCDLIQWSLICCNLRV